MRSFAAVTLLALVLVVASEPDPLCPYPSHDITFFPNPDDPTKYFECYEGTKFVMSCPPNLYWDQELLTCNRHTVDQNRGRDAICPYPSHDITFFANPSDCSKYIECYEGNKFDMNCPPNLYWNDVLNTCDYLQDVNCNRALCTAQADGTFFGDTSDCSKYYECLGGKSVTFQCPSGLKFNDVLKSCDFSENVKC